MSEKNEKNFRIIQNVLNEQAKLIRDQAERLTMLEGNVAALRADILNTKQLVAHVGGRGMGSTVHDNGD